jgi:hypothetical protein
MLGSTAAQGEVAARSCGGGKQRCRRDDDCCSGFNCYNGRCACADEWKTACKTICVNLKKDNKHCGRCGNTCKGELECGNKKCRCLDRSKSKCGTECPDIKTSNKHCGECGNQCKGDLTCLNGKCGCTDTTLKQCGTVCTNTETDVKNCGSCGKKCAGDQQCTNGKCGCASGQSICGGYCVDLVTDKNHCGKCGTKCVGEMYCDRGLCVCGRNLTNCPQAGSIICTNVKTDDRNCGACGTICSGSTPDCGEGTCTNFQTDPDNCGGSDRVCPGADPLRACRNGSCINLATDPNNCGVIGTICSAPNPDCGGGTCTNFNTDANNCGASGVACSGSTPDCGQGSCTNFQTDASNCGSSGNACAQFEVCIAGECSCQGGACFERAIDGTAGGGTALSNPLGVASRATSNILVVNGSSGAVREFSPDGSNVASYSISAGPGWLALDSGNNAYVTFTSEGKVRRYGPTFGTATWTSAASTSQPQGIAIFNDPDGAVVYVAAAGTNELVKIKASDGAEVWRYGSFGTGNRQFNQPRGVAVDANQKVYVVDQMNNRVQVFASNGTYQSEFNGTNGGTRFSFPTGIAVGANHVFVADTGNKRIVKLTLAGVFVSAWSQAGTESLQNPFGLSLNSNGRLYVTDDTLDEVIAYSFTSAASAALAQQGGKDRHGR